MTLKKVMKELEAKADPQTKKTWMRHGAKEPIFGVKIAEQKIIHKKIKGDQALALQLFDTGNVDAQYLAGIVADGKKMTAAQIQKWVETANFTYTGITWVASENPEGLKLALQWIDSPDEAIATAGWNVLGALAATVPDEALSEKQFSTLLDRVVKTMKSAKNGVRYAMNSFVICCGTYVAPLADKAIAAARKLGKVEVDMGDTACKVPEAESYIIKSRRGAPIAPKRKTLRC